MFQRTFVLCAVVAVVAGCGGGNDKTQSQGNPQTGSGGAFGGGGTASGGGGVSNLGGSPQLGSGGAAPACKPTGSACQSAAECCDGNTCNNTAGAAELNGCQLRCSQNSDCQSGCCVLFTGDTKGICGAAKFCSCGGDGSACGSQDPACCTTHVCLANDQAQSSYGCKKLCTTNADCATNCCVAIPTLNKSACLDATYCPAQ